MKNKLWITALIAVIGLSFTTCDDGSGTPPPPAHVHQWGEWVVTTPATCSAKGVKTRTCALDGTTETQEIPIDPDAHDWEQLTGTAPTCTEPGSGIRKCRICGIEETLAVIPPLGHDFQNWTQTTAPTCTTAGIETGTCIHDGTTTTTRPIPALGHNYVWTVTTPATYITAGVETETCTHDGTTNNTRTIDPLPITTALEWNDATTAISGGGNNKIYDINITGEFSIPGYSSATFGNVTGITVNIRGAGTITLAAGSTGNLLNIGTNQTVSLKDTHLKGHSTNNTSLVYVGGIFNMTGGTISDNTSSNWGGGGVYVVDEGIFNMTGGTISSNTASRGGGVYVEDGFYMSGIFNMTGGTISDNTASNYGGGVYVEGGFNLSGTAEIRDNNANRGGGICITNGDGYVRNVTITGGTISGNTATNTGGGMTVEPRTTYSEYKNVIMTGGIITGNHATNGVGGVLFNSRVNFDLLSTNLIINNTVTAILPIPPNFTFSGGTFLINGSTPDESLKFNASTYVW